ncbi:MAG: putative selenium-dependent hydroxylase accessory protein YqeC [Dehalococcoidales bacterium]|nr:putative selenium-dependent hydroxylase accessory protein YqeC [Dehalococcoidales bacterium]
MAQTINSLRQAFGIHQREVISLVGGGGKTTLMFALAQELASIGSSVITTTTTKIFEPLPSQTPLLLLEADEEEMIRLLLENVNRYRHITLASEKLTSGKLNGISPELVSRLAKVNRLSYIIVEADGAARKSLKAPNPTEPVIPSNTSLVIPIVGLDALGSRLTEENVFRPQIVSKLLGLPLGEVISAESIATLMTHPQGIIKGSPDRARIVPFINKVDIDKDLAKARDLASKILAVKHPQIKQVVLGQAQLPQPVIEVISMEVR